MPTYEYACRNCGKHIEVVQSFADTALTECPTCQGELRKVFGNIGITFKGSGFYKNDNRAPDKKSSSSEKSADKSAAKDSSTTDSKTSSDKSTPAPEKTSSPKPSSGDTSSAAS